MSIPSILFIAAWEFTWKDKMILSPSRPTGSPSSSGKNSHWLACWPLPICADHPHSTPFRVSYSGLPTVSITPTSSPWCGLFLSPGAPFPPLSPLGNCYWSFNTQLKCLLPFKKPSWRAPIPKQDSSALPQQYLNLEPSLHTSYSHP